ncbi:MAG: TlpA family protein disulfide reductase [Pedobacter sp.]|nr:TlpA family protein disulfide reductase [Pedobacter sp.]
MKKFLMMIAFFIAFNSTAQQVKTSIKLDKQSIVKDADGTVYTAEIWNKLLESGQYSIKPDNGGEFILFRLTPEQIKSAAERKKAMILTMAKPRVSDAFKEGEKFRGDRIKAINGNKFDLKTITDKVYVINFWFINCPPCKKEIPELNELVKKYKDNPNVVFIAIALDQEFELKNFQKIMPFDYNIVADGRYFSDKHGVKSYPTHVIIGKDGLIKFSTVGLAPNTLHWIEKTIQEQL